MQIVIDIDKEDWKDINDIHFIREDLKFKIGKAIMNGTPFPKHHGRLVDADKLMESILCKTFGLRSVDIENAPTIVEEDVEEDNEERSEKEREGAKKRDLIELRDNLEAARIHAGAEMEMLCNNGQWTDACVFQSIRDSMAQNIQLLRSYTICCVERSEKK